MTPLLIGPDDVRRGKYCIGKSPIAAELTVPNVESASMIVPPAPPVPALPVKNAANEQNAGDGPGEG
ncbi:hypothetical protein, partial [Gordonia sp. (in: high G+C Gram-positive bacteria)]|uniref:hypothetical protein n=1 Tax=Gordonia sp. (in: high G+C Gram-positive bacteria) TaxID=84139 RepID=UPI003C7065BC